MKKLFSILFFTAFLFNVSAQTSLFEHPKFDEIAKNHKLLAILPFQTNVELRPKQMKNMTAEQIHDLEKSEAKSIQSAMYSWFLKRKKRGDMQTVEVQDPSRTTALLLKKDITYENMEKYTPDELAKILGADAIIDGTYDTNKPMSDGASIALGLLVGFWGSTNTATVNMKVHNAEDGTMLWNYNKKVRGSIGSSPDDLINILMRKASRRLAYTKQE